MTVVVMTVMLVLMVVVLCLLSLVPVVRPAVLCLRQRREYQDGGGNGNKFFHVHSFES